MSLASNIFFDIECKRVFLLVLLTTREKSGGLNKNKVKPYTRNGPHNTFNRFQRKQIKIATELIGKYDEQDDFSINVFVSVVFVK